MVSPYTGVGIFSFLLCCDCFSTPFSTSYRGVLPKTPLIVTGGHKKPETKIVAKTFSFKSNKAPGEDARDVLTPSKKNGIVSFGSRVGVTVLFLCMTLRSLTALELVDQIMSSLPRIVIGLPILVLFIGNVISAAVTTVAPGRFKSYKKMIIFLNLVREMTDILWNMAMLSISVLRTNKSQIYKREPGFLYSTIVQDIFWVTTCYQYLKSKW